MNLKDRFLDQLQGKNVDITPVGCTTTYGVIELMGKSGAQRPPADTDPFAMTELSYAGHKYGGFEWIKAMGWDITALSEALGCRLSKPLIDRQFAIATNPFANDLHGLIFPSDFLSRGRFPAYRRHLELLGKKAGDALAVFGETEGAFTCAANLVGVQQLIKWCLKKPETALRVFEVTRQAATVAANFAFENGADYFVFAEPTSAPEILGPVLYEKFVLPLEREIIRAVHGPVVLHVCGDAHSIIELMCETGAAGISIEEKVDLKRAVEVAHAKKVKVFGNVATATLRSTPEAAFKESILALEKGTDFLCPGCGLSPHTPLENILQLKRARDVFFQVASDCI